jgi:hypothetical protein
MFRSDMTAVSLFGSHKAAPKPSFRPAVEALEERVVLDTGISAGGQDAALLAFNITQAATSLALRLQNAHLSKKGLGNLLQTEQGFRQVIQVLEASAPQDNQGFQQLLKTFHQADMVLIQEVTALANGHKIPADVENQAIALGQTVNAVNDLLDAFNELNATSSPSPSSSPCSSSSCTP